MPQVKSEFGSDEPFLIQKNDAKLLKEWHLALYDKKEALYEKVFEVKVA